MAQWVFFKHTQFQSRIRRLQYFSRMLHRQRNVPLPYLNVFSVFFSQMQIKNSFYIFINHKNLNQLSDFGYLNLSFF